MAIGAFIRRVLVNDDCLFADLLGLLMTFVAGDVHVPSRQGKMGLGVVIERRRNPALRIVALAAVRLSILGHELLVVSVVVAGFALLRRALES